MLLRRPGWRRVFAALGFLAAGFFWTGASSQKGVSASDAFRIAPSAAAQDYYWTRSFTDMARITQTRDGGYAATFSTADGTEERDIRILKLFPNGEIAWQRGRADSSSSIRPISSARAGRIFRS